MMLFIEPGKMVEDNHKRTGYGRCLFTFGLVSGRRTCRETGVEEPSVYLRPEGVKSKRLKGSHMAEGGQNPTKNLLSPLQPYPLFSWPRSKVEYQHDEVFYPFIHEL